MEYLLHLAILLGIYAILATSLDWVIGYARLFHIAHAALFGFGAYTAGLLALHTEVPFAAGLFVAAIVSALGGLAVASLSQRLDGDLFFFATLALQLILVAILRNWVSLTGGPLGLAGIPPAKILGWEFAGKLDYLIITALLLGICLLITVVITLNPFGRVLRLIRHDTKLASTYGESFIVVRMSMTGLSGFFAGISGVIFAHYLAFLDPDQFTVYESIYLLTVLLAGGLAHRWGGLIGATLFVLVPEVLRFLPLPDRSLGNLREILFALILLAIIAYRPGRLNAQVNP